MSPSIEKFLSMDEWSASEIESVRAAMAVDPVLRREVQTWMGIRSRLGHLLEEDAGAAGALVLHALYRSGRRMDLTDEEQSLVQASAERLDAAIALHPSLEMILDRVTEDAHAFERAWSDRPPVRRTTLRLLRPALAVAASVVALFAVVMLLRAGGAGPAEQTATITTGADEMRLVDLEDGTRVRLLEESTLIIPGDSPRSVSFAGKAFFDVSPAQSPFLIVSDNAQLRVMGTSFGIQARDAFTEVVLASGSVSLQNSDPDSEPVVLLQGQTSRVVNDEVPTTPVDVDVPSALSWTGLFIFRDTPLDRVAKAVEESFHVQVRIEDDLGSEELTGTFEKAQGAEEILRVVAAAMGARLEMVEADTSFVIRRR